MEKKIEGLVDSHVELEDSTAKSHVAKRIEQLTKHVTDIDTSIEELEGLDFATRLERYRV